MAGWDGKKRDGRIDKSREGGDGGGERLAAGSRKWRQEQMREA